MNITLNGKDHVLDHAPDHSVSIAELLQSLGLENKPTVVELNKEALFPREYGSITLADSDSVEIVAISAGG